MKVLIVDDEPGIRALFEAIVRQEGHEPFTAEDGQVALEKMEEISPDVVFTDVMMPNVDGLKLLEEIRSEDPDAIVIVITGAGTEEAAVTALRLGANNYLPKPVKATDIMELLKKYDAVVQAREVGKEIAGFVEARGLRMVFDNRLGLATRIAQFLVEESGGKLAKKDRMHVTLGLGELLTNAIEHGNLGITFDEKDQALSEEAGLSTLYNARMARTDLADRKVIVAFRAEPDFCEWTISDEGDGFDPDSIPSPLDKAQAFKKCGRGIFLCQKIFDEMEYTGKGNVVRVKKRISTPDPS
jgi:DNA-binding response OmpR family regulator